MLACRHRLREWLSCTLLFHLCSWESRFINTSCGVNVSGARMLAHAGRTLRAVVVVHLVPFSALESFYQLASRLGNRRFITTDLVG